MLHSDTECWEWACGRDKNQLPPLPPTSSSDLPPDDASSIAESEPQSLVAGGSSSVGGVDEEWEGSDISLTQDSEYIMGFK